jgi:hypothetical protein
MIMQIQDQLSEIASLHLQLKTAAEKFDFAVKNDRPLEDLKKLFHDMKELKTKLDKLKKHYPDSSDRD